MDNASKNNKSNNKSNNKINKSRKNNNTNNNNINFIVNKNANNGTYMSGESLVYVIGFLIILILIYNFFFVSSDDEETENEDEVKGSQCPDYWDVTDDKMCRNVHRIGKCGLENDIDFNDQIFTDKKTGDLMKCKWSKYCNVPWEHIDDLC